MSAQKVCFQPIGIIHSPFTSITEMPIQPSGAEGVTGSIDLYAEFVPALLDLEGFSHVYLLYHFHKVSGWKAHVTPFLDKVEHGLFATRAPKRPNAIGLSIVRLRSINGNRLEIENVDILDGTPLLDIKPYVPKFDHFEVQSIGWLQNASGDVQTKRSDTRFSS